MSVTQSLSLTESNVNSSDNTSQVRILWRSTQTGASWNGYKRTAKYYVSINGGAETEYSVEYTLPLASTTVILDKTITVSHTSTGAGSVSVRTWMDTGISAGVVEKTNSLTLTTIPRASTFDSISCDTAYFTGTFTYKYTPKSELYYNRLSIELYVDAATPLIEIKKTAFVQKATSQQTSTITLSEEELSIIYNKLPKVKKGVLYFSLITYSKSGTSYSQVGDAVTKKLTLSIPNVSDTQPTATMTLAPVSDSPLDSSSFYVIGWSKVKAVFTNGAGKYGATIASYSLTVEGKNYGSPYTSDYLTTAGSITVKGTVTDSRGYSRSYSQTITVLEYTKPAIDLVTSDSILFNSTLTYKYTPPNSTFYSRCVVTLGTTTVKTISLGQKNAGQNTATLTLSESELSVIYNKLPNDRLGTLKFTFRSFVDSGYTKQIGEDSYKEIKLQIPPDDTTMPTANLTRTIITSMSFPFDTLYIKGKSKVKVAITDCEGKFGASIVSSSVTFAGNSVPTTYTSDWLLIPGRIDITGTVTDSRGYSQIYHTSITVIDYSPPQILPVSGESEVIVARCDSSGNLSDTGTYLKIKSKRYYSKVISGSEQKNFCAIQYRYKESTGSYSSWITILDKTAASDEIVTGALLGTLDIAKSYFVQIRAIDDIGESVIFATTISTEKVYMHKAGSMNAFALGKYAEEEDSFDVAEDITAIFRGKVRFPGEAWIALELYSSVSESETNVGRYGGSGAYYRVCAGEKRICVIFNVKFTTSDSTVRVVDRYKTGTTVFQIPAAYRPSYDVYALCPVGFANGSRGIATVSVAPSGRVNIYAVHKLPGATLSTGEAVDWIDGYIDFWT